MSSGTIGSLTKNISKTLSLNSPTILTGMAVAGVVTTAVLTGHGTYKALGLVLEHVNKQKLMQDVTATMGIPVDPIKPLKPMDYARICWKPYLPAVLMGVATISCIIGANSIHLRRNAALAGVYALTESALKQYQAKVIETIGQRKEEKIHEEMAQDDLNKNPASQSTILITGNGESLCYDKLSGRYFLTNIEKVRKAVNDLNFQLLTEMWISLNDLYHELGIPNVDLGETMGWGTNALIEIRFTSKLTDEGKPCLVLDYVSAPDTYVNCVGC